MKLTPEFCAKQLAKRINSQIEFYGILSAVTKRQLKFINRGRINIVAEVLEKRQKLVEKLKVIARDAQVYRNYWASTRDLWPEEYAEEVRAAMQTLKQAVGAQAKLNAELETRVREVMVDLKSQMKTVKSARKVNQAYHPRWGIKPPHMNKVG